MGKRLGFGVPPSTQGFVRRVVSIACNPRESNEFFDNLSGVSPRHVLPLRQELRLADFLDWKQPVAASLLIHLPRPVLEVLWGYGWWFDGVSVRRDRRVNG